MLVDGGMRLTKGDSNISNTQECAREACLPEQVNASTADRTMSSNVAHGHQHSHSDGDASFDQSVHGFHRLNDPRDLVKKRGELTGHGHPAGILQGPWQIADPEHD